MLATERQEFNPDWFSRPADSLLGLMKRRRIPIEVVADALEGGVETLRELVRGTRVVDRDLALALSRAVGGAPNFWLKRQALYERALDLALSKAFGELDDWLTTVPAPTGGRPGRLSREKKEIEVRNRLAFYGVNSLRAWNARYGDLNNRTQFRTSRTFSSSSASVALWLRQGELEAALATTKPWNPEKLRASLEGILGLSKVRQPSRFLPKLRAISAEAGVAIVVVRAPKGCKASGASRLITPEKAMVLLSFRHLSDDHFWFTLAHEFGHLLLHGAKAFVDADDTPLDHREREANEFASSCIVPASRWEEFASLRYQREAVLRFSVSLGIAPGLVVGQLQHRGAIPSDRFNYLKRRWTWAEIESAIN